MSDPNETKPKFKCGNLVYYNGFEVFAPPKKYIGIVLEQKFERYYPDGEDHYDVFWFDSGLTTCVHYANMMLVYDEDDGKDI